MYRTSAFIRLGQLIDSILNQYPLILEKLVRLAQQDNPWFTAENVRLALSAISSKMLRQENLDEWLKAYPRPLDFTPKNVGIIMAGNIPLVGFFDLLCVSVTGHHAYVKTSSKDKALTERSIRALKKADPSLIILPLLNDSPLDAVIATGSNNTNRYFKSEYSGIPSLLRGSRTSLAVLTGNESVTDLRGLSHDIFDYFGMGCRNVARIFIPRGYDINQLVALLTERKITHPNYLHAYMHQKAILQMRKTSFIDGNFFTLRENDGFSEALPDLVYTTYQTLDEVQEWISFHNETVQCVITEGFDHQRRAGFGQAQQPELWDYPDGQDVIAFLYTI